MKTVKNFHPAMLSFAGSISPSQAFMYSCDSKNDDALLPVIVEKVTVRGTACNHLKAPSEDKVANPNIQRIDVANLPASHDTLVVKGTVKFLNNAAQPSGINETKGADKKGDASSFSEAYTAFFSAYKGMDGFMTLAERYLMNILNGAILWRNNDSALSTTVQVKVGDAAVVVNREHIDPSNRLSFSGILTEDAREDARKVARVIADALAGKTEAAVLTYSAKAFMGYGQPVYPSQEFIDNKKEKTLAKVEAIIDGRTIPHACIHSQKIGNAIRTIDTWYKPNATFPIAVEPWGVHQTEQRAYRFSNGLYAYIDRLGEFTGKDDPTTHYLMGCFIRGGVFGKQDSKEGA